MVLSDAERVILLNQYSILNTLNTTDEYDIHIEIIKNGFTELYSNIFNISDEVDSFIQSEVFNILNMYRQITYTLGDNIEESYKFNGFDTHEEGGIHGWFADFLINTTGRYTELKYGKDTINCINEVSILHQYRGMLNVWWNLPNQVKLTPEQVSQIFNYLEE
jgi:uncharacterized protein YfbU (UPF0304 family)